MDRCRIGQQQGCAFGEASAVGKRDRALGRDDQLLGKTSPKMHRDQAIADGPALDPLTDRLDLPRNFAPWRERTRWLELIFVFDDQNVGIVDGRRTHADEQLAGARSWIGYVGQLERPRPAGLAG